MFSNSASYIYVVAFESCFLPTLVSDTNSQRAHREYEAAVQELSICMAFAPEDEAEVLEPFVEKLHLMRLETSWKSLGQKGRLTIT